MTARYFEDLEVWKMAQEITKNIYAITREKYFSRDYSLIDQMRRASIAVMLNISEGFERGGNQEFQQFLYVAKGSYGELRYQLYIASVRSKIYYQERYD